MLRKAGTVVVAGVLGVGSALGLAACGEERGTVTVEEGTGTTGTATAGTTSPTTSEP